MVAEGLRFANRKEGSLMHRLLAGLLLLTLMLPALTAPVIVAAQDAEPPEVDATDVRYVVPFTQDGLNASLTEAGTDEAACTAPSIVALDRPDAWSCFGVTNEIYDPCFENPFLPPDQQTELACFETPLSTDVVIVTLTDPLVRKKAEPTPAMAEPTPDAGVIEPWELPWAFDLANGDRCSLLRGTLIAMAGQVVHYGCADGGLVLGEVDTDEPVWTVNYLAADDFASNVIDVTVAWS
jgi:hypothetical protein